MSSLKLEEELESFSELQFPVRYRIEDGNLYVYFSPSSDTEDLEDIEGIELIVSKESDKACVRIDNPGKQHAEIIGAIDSLVGYDKASIVNLEDETKHSILGEIWEHLTFPIRFLHPRNFVRPILSHGPYLGAALLIGSLVDELVIPYFAITTGHLEILPIMFFHIPEMLCVGAYIAGIKAYSILKRKKLKYGDIKSDKLRNYLANIESGNHEGCEYAEISMERALHTDCMLGGKKDLIDMNLLINHQVDYLLSHRDDDLYVVAALSKRLRKSLSENYTTWKAYLSAVAIEHMAELDEFGAKELIRFKVLRDNIIHLVLPEQFQQITACLSQRLTSHHKVGKSHDPKCPVYRIMNGEVV